MHFIQGLAATLLIFCQNYLTQWFIHFRLRLGAPCTQRSARLLEASGVKPTLPALYRPVDVKRNAEASNSIACSVYQCGVKQCCYNESFHPTSAGLCFDITALTFMHSAAFNVNGKSCLHHRHAIKLMSESQNLNLFYFNQVCDLSPFNIMKLYVSTHIISKNEKNLSW